MVKSEIRKAKVEIAKVETWNLKPEKGIKPDGELKRADVWEKDQSGLSRSVWIFTAQTAWPRG